MKKLLLCDTGRKSLKIGLLHNYNNSIKDAITSGSNDVTWCTPDTCVINDEFRTPENI